MVGLTGFEPAAPASRTRCSTKLSYNPIYRQRLALGGYFYRYGCSSAEGALHEATVPTPALCASDPLRGRRGVTKRRNDFDYFREIQRWSQRSSRVAATEGGPRLALRADRS